MIESVLEHCGGGHTSHFQNQHANRSVKKEVANSVTAKQWMAPAGIWGKNKVRKIQKLVSWFRRLILYMKNVFLLNVDFN